MRNWNLLHTHLRILHTHKRSNTYKIHRSDIQTFTQKYLSYMKRHTQSSHIYTPILKGVSCGAVVKALDYRIVVREFMLQPRYYVHFRTNIVFRTKVYTPLSSHLWVKYVFIEASHQTGLDTRSKARKPIKVGIKGRGRSWTSRDSNPAGHWPNVGLMSQAVSRT